MPTQASEKALYPIAKRAIDCVLSATAITALLPLLLAVALAVKLMSPGPVFYLGRRVGLHGRVFRVIKFRSMVVNAEEMGGSATAEDDPRLTRLGIFLRNYKIDELPQLVNVLRGDMSLVGPRPEVEKYVAIYNAEERAILSVQPGITDWASIWNFQEGAVLAGSKNPERMYELVIRPTKLRLQLLYVREQCFSTDAAILFHTVMKMVFRSHWMPRKLEPYPGPLMLPLAVETTERLRLDRSSSRS